MSSLWIAALVLAASPPGKQPDSLNSPGKPVPAATAVSPAGITPASPRSGRELESAVRAALRRWVKPTEAEANQAAKDFLVFYREIVQDTKLGPATREELRNKVRNRLANLADQISRQVARENRAAKGPKRLETPPDKTGPMAQMGGGMGPGMGGGFGQPGFGGAGIGGMGGSGGGMGGFGPGGMGMIPDNGQALVDLIYATIAPATWDVNGGPGAIYYWRPQHALIIRQSAEVHGQIGDTLKQLERANR